MEDWKTLRGEIELYPWFHTALKKWASTFPEYRNSTLPTWDRFHDGNILPGKASVTEAAPVVREYFANLLWWSHFALEAGSEGAGMDLLTWNGTSDALKYWESMCDVDADQVPIGADTSLDNALVRLLRTAAAGTHRMLAGVQKSTRMLSITNGQNGHAEKERGLHCDLPNALRRADLKNMGAEYAKTSRDFNQDS